MRLFRTPLLALCLFAGAAFPAPGLAQQAVPAIETQIAPALLSQPQYDELVAPVALYPDALLADVLAASTYPLQVVDADRWLADPVNASLSGDDLAAALDTQYWDPSVKALAPFPDVLSMLDSHLPWFQELGAAFLADPDAVLGAVQRMRARARAAGNLSSNAEETVSDTDNEIAISAPPSDDLYVPQYDPWCAFGNWPYSAPPPYFFEPWPGYCEAPQYAVDFASGIAWPFGYWGWGYFDWPHKRLLVRRDYYNRFHPASVPASNVWRHDAREDRVAATHAAQSARVLASLKGARPLAGRGLARMQQPLAALQRFNTARVAPMAPQRRFAAPQPMPRRFVRRFAREPARAGRPSIQH